VNIICQKITYYNSPYGKSSQSKLTKVLVLFSFLFLICSLQPVFGQSVANQQSSAPGQFQLGMSALDQGNYFESIQRFQQSLSINPQYAQALGGMAQAYFYLDEFDEALIYIDRALALSPRSLEFQNFRGRVLLTLGNTQQAQQVFNQILRDNPLNRDALLGQAELLLTMGNLNQAQQALLNTLSIHPRDRRTLLSLAVLNQSLGNTREAERYVQRALEFYADNPLVHTTAARLYYDIGDLDAAEFHIRIALDLRPDHFEALFLQTNLFIQRGMYSNALRPLNTIINQQRNSDHLLYIQGLVFYRLNRINEAIQSQQATLRINPENEVARSFLELIVIDENLDFQNQTRRQLAEFRLQQARQFELQNRFERAIHFASRGLILSPFHEQLRRIRADLFLKTQRIPEYVDELSFLVREIGVDDRNLRDQLEVYEHLLLDRLASRVGIDQFEIAPDYRTISLYALNTQSHHPQAVRFIAQQTAETLLFNYQRFSLQSQPEFGRYREPLMITSLEQAFLDARTAGTDYFVVLSIDEGPRRIHVRADLYLSRTGRLIESFQVTRTGNNRVTEAVLRITEGLNSFIPYTATLISRTFNQGIINLGSRSGLQIGQMLPIVSRTGLLLRSDGRGYVQSTENTLGTFEVTALDAFIAQGRLTSTRFFDSIAIGDKLLFQSQELEAPNPASVNFPLLYNRIRGIR
jgi:tetratricopeptide (TPR) repeat protein